MKWLFLIQRNWCTHPAACPFEAELPYLTLSLLTSLPNTRPEKRLIWVSALVTAARVGTVTDKGLWRCELEEKHFYISYSILQPSAILQSPFFFLHIKKWPNKKPTWQRMKKNRLQLYIWFLSLILKRMNSMSSLSAGARYYVGQNRGESGITGCTSGYREESK